MIRNRKHALADLACTYAQHFLGTPYRWGGDDPSGLDCSGLVVELLQAVGLMARGTDATADMLYRKFPVVAAGDVAPGCLVYFGKPERVTHVELVFAAIEGRVFTIGASGGGSKTLTAQDAWSQNAYVKIRPVGGPGSRTDLVGWNDPFVEG